MQPDMINSAAQTPVHHYPMTYLCIFFDYGTDKM